jgi:hypothetical protein
VATFASAHCQLTASKLFASAPASVMPLLTRNTRLDMIDYFSVGSTTTSKNAMQGQSRITALTPMSLSAVVTSSSECQLALLPMRGDTAVVYIETVHTPAPDSRVAVYDRNWKPLAKASFAMPQLSAWLTKEGAKNADMVNGLAPFMLASAAYSPETQTLTLTNHLAEFLSTDVYKSIEPYLLAELTYRWDSSRFTLSK